MNSPTQTHNTQCTLRTSDTGRAVQRIGISQISRVLQSCRVTQVLCSSHFGYVEELECECKCVATVTMWPTDVITETVSAKTDFWLKKKKNTESVWVSVCVHVAQHDVISTLFYECCWYFSSSCQLCCLLNSSLTYPPPPQTHTHINNTLTQAHSHFTHFAHTELLFVLQLTQWVDCQLMQWRATVSVELHTAASVSSLLACSSFGARSKACKR